MCIMHTFQSVPFKTLLFKTLLFKTLLSRLGFQNKTWISRFFSQITDSAQAACAAWAVFIFYGHLFKNYIFKYIK